MIQVEEPMIAKISRMLALCDSDERLFPPTNLYNEGWLLRVLLHLLANNPGCSNCIGIPKGKRWYSEALLATQFSARKRSDSLSEKHTHADGVIGDFIIGQTGKGDLRLLADVDHFVVIEAKLGSPLSKRTTNAPGYDQVARTVACMAHALSEVKRSPDRLKRLAFYVVAPSLKIKRGQIDSMLLKTSIEKKVAARVEAYNDPLKTSWLLNWFQPTLQIAEIKAISWEDAIADATQKSSAERVLLEEFYDQCKLYNGLK